MPALKLPCRKTVVVAMFISISAVFVSHAAETLVAYWPFDSSSQNVCFDATGHGHDVVMSGDSVGIAKGIVGNALECRGKAAEGIINTFDVKVDNSVDSFDFKRFSIECWVYSYVNLVNPGSPYNSKAIFEYSRVGLEGSGVTGGYLFAFDINGKLQFACGKNQKWYYTTGDSVVLARRWYHVAATYDSLFLKIYVNGRLAAKTGHSIGYESPKIAARIGCQYQLLNDTTGRTRTFFNGLIDELKIYDGALSADTVKAHYWAINTGIPVLIPFEPNPTIDRRPVFRWHSNSLVSIFRLQIASASTFASLIVTTPLPDTFYAPPVDLPLGTICWRVRNEEDTLSWSPISWVTIQDSAVPIIIPYAPDPTFNRRPLLQWHPVAGAQSYTIHIYDQFYSTSPRVNDVVSDTFYTPSLDLPVNKIYWMVRSDRSTQFSAIDTFTIKNDSIPILFPMIPDTQTTKKPVFSWHPGSGNSSYRIQIDTMRTFAAPFISVPLSDTFYSPLTDLPSGTIYWRVSADVNITRYSEVDTFVIVSDNFAYPGVSRKIPRGLQMAANTHTGRLHVAYTVDKPGHISLKLFSLSGKCVATLHEGFAAPGAYTMTWSDRIFQGTAGYSNACILAYRCNGATIAIKMLLFR